MLVFKMVLHSTDKYFSFLTIFVIGIAIVLPGCREKDYSSVPFHLSSTVDTTTAAVGDIVHFQVWVEGAGNKKIDFPQYRVDNPNISIGNRRMIEGEFRDNYGVEFEITFWDTGSFELPPYSVDILTSSGDSVDFSMVTDPIFVEVISVLTDPQPGLKDIKPPVPIPIVIPFRLIFKVIVLIIIVGITIWLWKKRVPTIREKETQYIPTRPPFEIAMERLSKLKKCTFETDQSIEKYYSWLSFIVKEFIEYQYFVRAIEMTTEEIEMSRRLIPVDVQLFVEVIEVLKRSDFVKFAKFRPSKDRCKKDLEVIEKFIQFSKLEWGIKTKSTEFGAMNERI